LRGCGLTDWEIAAMKLHDPGLAPPDIAELVTKIHELRATSPIQIGPVFISYSHHDHAFVDALGGMLDEVGIRYWRDKEHLMAGRIEKQLGLAMKLYPTVILVLSHNSVESDWVEWEASKARELEKELDCDVLCPIALDSAWTTCQWPGPLRHQIENYHIVDFSSWQDVSFRRRQFKKLVEGLSRFYSPK
jgi:hypothetical protein